jgi:hypothetical protein
MQTLADSLRKPSRINDTGHKGGPSANEGVIEQTPVSSSRPICASALPSRTLNCPAADYGVRQQRSPHFRKLGIEIGNSA